MDLSERSVVVTGAGRGLGRAYVLALLPAAPVPRTSWSAARSARSAGSTRWSPTPASCATGWCERCPTTSSTPSSRCTCAGRSPAPARPRCRCASRATAGGSSWPGHRPGSAATSDRPTTPRPKPASRRWPRTWAKELGRSNITVNAVVPSAATPMTATIPAFEPYVRAFEERGEPFPPKVRRAAAFGSADDVAGLIAFLASEAAASITGQCIGIGGDKLTLWSHPQEVAPAGDRVGVPRRRLVRRRHRGRLVDHSVRRTVDLRHRDPRPFLIMTTGASA